MSTHSLKMGTGSTAGLAITDGSQVGLDLSGDFTLECWARHNTDDPTATEMLLGKWEQSASSQLSYRMYFSGLGTLTLAFSTDGSSQVNISQALSIGADEWHHYAGVRSGTSLLLYFDGVEVDSATGLPAGAIHDGTNDFTVGKDHNAGSGQRWDGNIDQVRVWGVARTAAEIFQNYQVDIVSAANLEGSWSLDNVLTDGSGNGNTLTSSDTTFELNEVHGFAANSGIDSNMIAGSLAGEFTSVNASIFPGATKSEFNPPSISNVSPADASELADRSTPVSFDVTDDTATGILVISLKYAGANETCIVHDGANFLSPFNSSTSARSAITGGYRYTILPDDGWLNSIDSLEVFATDTSGNVLVHI